MKQKGIDIHLLSICLFFSVSFIMVAFGLEVQKANIHLREQMQIEESRRLCDMESQTLSDASDYLTSEVWRFVSNRNKEHMENYWTEVEQTKRREQALENLAASSLTSDERYLIEGAKRESDNLIDGEAWAMRLVADSIGMDTGQMPGRVASVLYEDGEESLSPSQKRELAIQYMFGEEYSASKQLIRSDISSFRQLLQKNKSAQLDTAVAGSRRALRKVQLLMMGLILVFLLEAILYYFLILQPFHYYAIDLSNMNGKNFTRLTPRGSRETKTFANVFNQIYTDWQRQKTRMEQERYRFHVALEDNSVIIYEYNPSTDTYTAFGSLENNEKCVKQPVERVFRNFLKEYASSLIDGQNPNCLRGLITGKDCTPVELRVRPQNDENSNWIWVRITGTPICDNGGEMIKLIGKITNIQSEKEKEFALEDARSRDGLTGLYQREAGIRKVREYMETKSAEEICGIMLLDMDNFKQINESEGRVFADAVLQEVADILRAKTGPEDIQIRLGGDEFMLFIKGCPNSRATVLGSEIAKAIRSLSQNTSPIISASIGVCVTEVADEYSGLYRCAESTLKYVKEHARGTSACYLDICNELGTMLIKMYPEQYWINKIDRSAVAAEDLASFALDLLGKAKNLDDAIYLLLTRVGNICRLDRILIVEINAEYLSYRAVYQWVKNQPARQSQESLYITREQLADLSSAYDAEGLCERRILNGFGKMESILHAAIWNYGECVGSMIFELNEPHHWTVDDRKLLSELTKIISSFTLKAKADTVSQAKTDFLSRMSHEIRTPMNAITGMTAIAKTTLGDRERTLDCLNKIEAANKFLLSLINDVLDMSRIESGKVEIHPTEISIGKLTDDIDILIRPQAEAKGLNFIIENEFSGRQRVLADELRLNQVLVNLLGNAVKFTGEGGKITLHIEEVESDARQAVLLFSVSDTGIGISREAQGRIFNAFEQAGSETAYNYGGTGLGLAISSRLVQIMGGALEVKSVPKEGSRFYFSLHLSFADGTDENDGVFAEPKADSSSFDPSGSRLLLAEDNELNQEIAQELLTMNGFIVETASDGLEALGMFEGHPPGYYAAILMDIRMPVMDGREATRRIRTLGKQDSRTIPIIAMTADAFDEDMKRSLENGMNGHLSKPIDIEQLLQTLGEVIHKSN